MGEPTELRASSPEVVVTIAQHTRLQGNIDPSLQKMCGCGEGDEEKYHEIVMARQGYRNRSDVLNSALLSHHLRDTVFKGCKAHNFSVSFDRSVVMACKGLRQDLLSEVGVLRITAEDEPSGDLSDLSICPNIRDFVSPFPNLTRLELDWTHLQEQDSRLRLIDGEHLTAMCSLYDSGVNSENTTIRKYTLPSLISLQIKTESIPLNINVLADIGGPVTPLEILAQLHLPNLRNLHWTHSYEGCWKLAGTRWIPEYCKTQHWCHLESLSLCLTLQSSAELEETRRAIKAIFADTIRCCGEFTCKIDIRLYLLHDRADAPDDGLEQLVRDHMQDLLSYMPDVWELADPEEPPLWMSPALQLTFSVFGEVPFYSHPVPLISVKYVPPTDRNFPERYNPWRGRFNAVHHEADVYAIMEDARNTGWGDPDDEVDVEDEADNDGDDTAAGHAGDSDDDDDADNADDAADDATDDAADDAADDDDNFEGLTDNEEYNLANWEMCSDDSRT